LLTSKLDEGLSAEIVGITQYASLCIGLSAGWFLLMFWFDGPYGGLAGAWMTLGAGSLFGLARTAATKNVRRIAIYVFGALPVLALTAWGYRMLASRL
jgi:hypothetical protein